MPQIRVSVYEDNQNLRETLGWIIESSEELLLVGSHENPAGVLEEISAEFPDVVIMDIEMPVMNGIEALRKMKVSQQHSKVLMFTVFEDTERIFEAIKAGAVGYLLKNTSHQKLIEGIKDAFSGGAAMSPSIALKVLGSFKESAQNPYNLTPKEIEVLRRLVEGDSYKLIALHQNRSINTIEKHVRHIYEKLQVNSKGEAITKAYRDKLLD